MRLEAPKNNIENFNHTFKVERDLFLLYEFLVIFDGSINISNKLAEKKLKDLIGYLSHLIYPLPPHDYAYADEELFITDTYEKEKF